MFRWAADIAVNDVGSLTNSRDRSRWPLRRVSCGLGCDDRYPVAPQRGLPLLARPAERSARRQPWSAPQRLVNQYRYSRRCCSRIAVRGTDPHLAARDELAFAAGATAARPRQAHALGVEVGAGVGVADDRRQRRMGGRRRLAGVRVSDSYPACSRCSRRRKAVPARVLASTVGPGAPRHNGGHDWVGNSGAGAHVQRRHVHETRVGCHRRWGGAAARAVGVADAVAARSDSPGGVLVASRPRGSRASGASPRNGPPPIPPDAGAGWNGTGVGGRVGAEGPRGNGAGRQQEQQDQRSRLRVARLPVTDQRSLYHEDLGNGTTQCTQRRHFCATVH